MQILILLITCWCYPYPSHQRFSSDQCNHLAMVLLTVHSLLSGLNAQAKSPFKAQAGPWRPPMGLCEASFYLVLIAGLTSSPPIPHRQVFLPISSMPFTFGCSSTLVSHIQDLCSPHRHITQHIKFTFIFSKC